jgi:hypothetical protein
MAVAIGPSWLGNRDAKRDLGREESSAAFCRVLAEGRVERRVRAFWYCSSAHGRGIH